jgi:hypothetical protein
VADFRLSNGRPRVTVIQRFDRKATLLGPEHGKKRIFQSMEEMKEFIRRRRWEVNIEHLHPGSGAGELRPETYHFIKES